MKKSIVSFVISCFLFLVLAFPVSAKTIVNVKHDNTIGSIVEMVNKYPHSGFNSGKISQYQEVPNFTAPYRAGSLQEQEFKDAENVLKMVRFLGGVPYERAVFTKEYNDIAQHGAVLLASSNQFSHSPSKPSDMSNYFYEVAYRGCSESNISAGRSNISAAVLGFMYDSGSNNIAHAGHRRWILTPGNQEYGIGYAAGSNASYGGHRINMYVFGDENDSSWNYESDSYIAWPSAGAFPLQYLLNSNDVNTVSTCPWSINLGSPYMAPTKSSVVLTLTRNSDGKVWTFDSTTPNLEMGGYTDNTLLHLATDNSGYGIAKAIVFRPDPASLGVIQDGEVFHVKLTGIYTVDGTPTTLEYDTYFFNLAKYAQGFDPSHVHFWDDGCLTAPATCAEPGVRTYTCVGCGLTRSEQIPALGHVPVEGYCTLCGKLGFNDVVEGVYYYDAVEWAVNNEITNGYGSDVIFAPDGICNRGQIVTFLWRANGSPEPTSLSNPFVDVAEDTYYYKAVLWAVENGITAGYGSDTIFNPDGACNRAQVATFLWRASGKPAMEDADNPFTDIVSGEYYYEAVLWAVENGITYGYGDNTTYAPDLSCSRSQIVTFLYRAMN